MLFRGLEPSKTEAEAQINRNLIPCNFLTLVERLAFYGQRKSTRHGCFPAFVLYNDACFWRLASLKFEVFAFLYKRRPLYITSLVVIQWHGSTSYLATSHLPSPVPLNIHFRPRINSSRGPCSDQITTSARRRRPPLPRALSPY